MKVVLDTNIILASLYNSSPYHKIFISLYNLDFELYITTEILLDYEEKIADFFSKVIAQDFIKALFELKNVHKIDRLFKSEIIIVDLDDNKFIECAYAGNVNCIVSNDKHFDVLKKITFPQMAVINIDEFIKLLESNF